MAVIYGTNSSNSMRGTLDGADQIFGWDAANAPGDEGPASDSDRLYAQTDDTVMGGAGNDSLVGDEIDDAFDMYGGAGDDVLSAGLQGGNHLFGGDGVDLWIVQGSWIAPLNLSVADLVAGLSISDPSRPVPTVVSGIDRINITGTVYGDTITGGDYADTIHGGGGADLIAGGGGNDLLSAAGGNFHPVMSSTVQGGAGDDTVVSAYGINVLSGGQGTDLLDYTADYAGAGMTVVLSAAMVLADGTVANGFERLAFRGNGGDDHITGGALGDTLIGYGGNDVLDGLGGNDLLVAVLRAADQAQVLDGGTGDDTIEATLGAHVQVLGGDGTDLLYASFTTSRVGIALSAAALAGSYTLANGAQVSGIEHVLLIGSNKSDSLSGTALGDTLLGQNGYDLLSGGGGDDVINGGQRNDTLYGGDGNDRLTDNSGANILVGGAGDDVLVGTSIRRGYLYGGTGDDSLTSGNAGDNISGGAGSDEMTGRAGADHFIFSTAAVAGEVDQITDFRYGADTIVLSHGAFGGLAVGALAAADFVAGVTAGDASDRIIYDAATGRVWFDSDGLGGAEAVLFLTVNANAELTFAYFSVV